MTNAITDLTSGREFLKHEKIKHIPHRDVLIKADKGRISQVISNLLSNAIEFTTEGTILVSIEKDKINDNNKTIIVSVKDSGHGIDSSMHLDKLNHLLTLCIEMPFEFKN